MAFLSNFLSQEYGKIQIFLLFSRSEKKYPKYKPTVSRHCKYTDTGWHLVK